MQPAFSFSASAPSVVTPAFRRHANRFAAFTLIELLTVIAIIGVLAGITFGVVKGVQERSSISRARSELAALSMALEAYKRQYGDYPQLGSSAISNSTAITATASNTSVEGLLFNALLGKIGPKGDPIQGKQFLEASKFALQGSDIPTPGNANPVNNGFIDPWGRLYVYYYKASGSTSWKQPSFVLLSAGPDGITGISVGTDGRISESPSGNTNVSDNIYANR